MADTYTVVKGDTLSEIAQRFKSKYGFSGTYDYVNELARINRIKNPNYIVVGQVIKLKEGAGGGTTATTPSLSRATITVFGLQSNTDRTVYACWDWNGKNTDHYQTIWYYDTGDGIWFIGDDTTTKDNQSLYNAPSNARRVRFKVKPISKKHKVNNKEVSYWTASWSTMKFYSFSDNPPTTPPVPTVKIDKYTLTAEVNNLNVNAKEIQFQVVKNNKTIFRTGSAKIKTTHASFSCTVDAGNEYKVRCRAFRDGLYSDWSEYSNNSPTIPSATRGITTLKATSKTSIYIEWQPVGTATSYAIEYTTKKEYFDGSDKVTSVTGILFNHYEKTGLESGQEYFFRVRAVNSGGDSAWSEIKSIIIGKDPAAPTTWSSVTTVTTGESLNLYWVHNSEDGSKQTTAELELYINGRKELHTIQNTTPEGEKEKTSVYTVNTSQYNEGTKIQWRVRTAGITAVYGPWSMQRTIDVYAPPTLQLSVTNKDGVTFDTLNCFPLYINAIAGPSTQVPIGYQLTISANESYETVNDIGNVKMVNKDEVVYSKFFDISDPLLVELQPGHVNLENNISYTITCVVTMNSGLTAKSTSIFTVAWTDEFREPNAEIGIDKDTLMAYIQPFCETEFGVRVQGVTLSVYRREFDGTFTELGTGLDNSKNTFITDPHPALDYARYRIVATTNTTGAITFYDVPGCYVGEKSVIIQWDEEWTNFESSSQDSLEEPVWAGSMLKLPYNIDVSDSNSLDVSLVEYIGRKHPVSYYGTQIGQTSNWKVEIEKSDKETLYALRRLAIWTGDVYVREPSGSGYWANISVSFSQTHCEVTIPVSLKVTRVEGGI